ncbi:MAG: hypothetical protein ABI627_26515 [Polyangiaceae bacterium]
MPRKSAGPKATKLVRDYLEQGALQAVTGSEQQAREAVDELLAVWSKHAG